MKLEYFGVKKAKRLPQIFIKPFSIHLSRLLTPQQKSVKGVNLNFGFKLYLLGLRYAKDY